jgi:hypothetical protein
MGKIPNYLVQPDNPEALTDLVVYEWSTFGLHMDDVHRWACEGEAIPDGLTDRVDYLLEFLDDIELMEPLHEVPLHPSVKEWRSVALMTINCINGGSVPCKVYP